MEIIIKMVTGKCIHLEVDPSDMIAKVKRKIWETEGLEIRNQSLKGECDQLSRF